jgi:hypothetical protein
MCLDFDNCRWAAYYRKHQPAPRLRGAPRHEIDRETGDRRASLFYPDVDQQDLEERCLRQGKYVESAKRATVYKVMDFGLEVGASDGQSSRWVLVEVTNTEFHGRPITRENYERRIRKEIACC